MPLPQRLYHPCSVMILVALFFITCNFAILQYEAWSSRRQFRTVPTGFSSDHRGWYSRSTPVVDVTRINLNFDSGFKIIGSTSSWGNEYLDIAILGDGFVITRTGVVKLLADDFAHFEKLSEDVKRYNKKRFDTGSIIRDGSTSKLWITLSNGRILHFSQYMFNRNTYLKSGTPLPPPLLELYGLLSPREEVTRADDVVIGLTDLVNVIETRIKADASEQWKEHSWM
jgi:hypothetical protein